jgi:hypothetical protein
MRQNETAGITSTLFVFPFLFAMPRISVLRPQYICAGVGFLAALGSAMEIWVYPTTAQPVNWFWWKLF